MWVQHAANTAHLEPTRVLGEAEVCVWGRGTAISCGNFINHFHQKQSVHPLLQGGGQKG